jgi:hypothetical protein
MNASTLSSANGRRRVTPDRSGVVVGLCFSLYLTRRTQADDQVPGSRVMPSILGPLVEITCRVYRPWRPRELPLFRLVEQHVEDLLDGVQARWGRTGGQPAQQRQRVLSRLREIQAKADESAVRERCRLVPEKPDD